MTSSEGQNVEPRRPGLLGNIIMLAAATAALGAVGYGLYSFSSYANGAGDALKLSLVVLVGLALVVALFAALAIVYNILGVQDGHQPLAFPEGSVRSLIAFSLLLIFVCLATFLYQGTVSPDLVAAGKVSSQTAAQIAELRKSFVVVDEPVPPAAGATAAPATPLFNATYYNHQRSKEADDFGKQIFTTLATVFVSVVSFYFGSSTTSSAVGAGVKAALTPPVPPSPQPANPVKPGDQPLKPGDQPAKPGDQKPDGVHQAALPPANE